MPLTYEPIVSQTVNNSTTSNLTFINIPVTFTDLILIVTGGVNPGAGDDLLSLRFNGDTGTNYSQNWLLWESGPPYADRSSNRNTLFVSRSDAGGNGFLRVHIMSYANVNINKTVLSEGIAPNRSRQGLTRNSGLWRSNAAITSITLRENSDSFLFNGLQASLYGIKAA